MSHPDDRCRLWNRASRQPSFSEAATLFAMYQGGTLRAPRGCGPSALDASLRAEEPTPPDDTDSPDSTPKLAD